jgi:hypothetical protein
MNMSSELLLKEKKRRIFIKQLKNKKREKLKK